MYGSVLTAKTSNKLSLFKAKFSPGAIAEQFSVNVTVKLTESGTLEIFQLFLLCWDQSQQSKTCEQTTKPQTNSHSCLRFSFVTADWLISCNTINGFVSFVSLTVILTHPFLTVCHKNNIPKCSHCNPVLF